MQLGDIVITMQKHESAQLGANLIENINRKRVDVSDCHGNYVHKICNEEGGRNLRVCCSTYSSHTEHILLKERRMQMRSPRKTFRRLRHIMRKNKWRIGKNSMKRWKWTIKLVVEWSNLRRGSTLRCRSQRSQILIIYSSSAEDIA